ncbi:MAG: hypothetical protein FWF47_07575 [Clostridia bacterium]|nr:hypothetical protein [Clostridia bacterium]
MAGKPTQKKTTTRVVSRSKKSKTMVRVVSLVLAALMVLTVVLALVMDHIT